MSTEATERPLPAVIQQAGGLQLRSVDDLSRLAKAIAESGYFKDADTPQKVAVKMLYAMTMGFDPIAGLQGVDLIDGTPTPNAHFWAAAIEDSPLYDYEVRERTAERCTIAFFRRNPDGSWRQRGEATWTLDDARTAELADKKNWRHYPRAMLYSRAMTEGGRAFCPGLFGGVRAYAPEELRPDEPLDQATIDYATGEVIELPAAPLPPAGGESPPAPAPASSGADTPAPPASGTQGSAGEPGQVLPAEPLDPGVQAWRRLFRDNDCPKPTPVERDRVRDAARAFGIEGNDDLGKLCDERTFAHVWLAARAQLGRSVGAYDRTPGQVSFTTPVPSRSAGSYQVTLWAGDRRDECTCEAGRHKRECRHLAVAMDYLRVYVEGDAYARRDFAVRLGLTEPADANEAAADRAWDAAGAAAELEGLAGD